MLTSSSAMAWPMSRTASRAQGDGVPRGGGVHAVADTPPLGRREQRVQRRSTDAESHRQLGERDSSDSRLEEELIERRDGIVRDERQRSRAPWCEWIGDDAASDGAERRAAAQDEAIARPRHDRLLDDDARGLPAHHVGRRQVWLA